MAPDAALTSEYIGKDIAAHRLNLSPRRVLELAGEGKLRQIEIRNPQSGRKQTVFYASDVDHLALERCGGISVAARIIAPSPQTSAASATSPPIEEEEPNPYDAVPPCSWLAPKDAAVYSGLPTSFLLSLIRTGKLPALDVGIREGGRYRVKRSDLDLICGAAIATPGD